jgi:threonine dehydrogenase-like Zn-dependent dehydrogenase
MQALVFTRPGVVEVLDVDEPVAQAGEVIVEVAAAGICGSELHGISQPGFRTPPLVMGHEFAGVTADGTRVTVNPVVTCGQCDLCQAGLTQVCRDRAIVGIHRPGAFAERVAVPEQMVHPLPDGLSWERAAMIEPLANAVHAWGLADRPKGARVGVIGAGTIGLVSYLAAKAGQAGEVVVVDVADDRLSTARDLGATTATSLEGEFDVVIDAVGVAATHQASVDRLRPGGTAVWVGLMGTDPAFNSQDFIRTEKRVLGSFAYTDAEFGEAVELAGRADLDWVDSYPLADGARIFTELMHGRTDVVKALLRPQTLG